MSQTRNNSMVKIEYKNLYPCAITQNWSYIKFKLYAIKHTHIYICVFF